MGEIMNLIEELNRKIDALVKQNEELKLSLRNTELANEEARKTIARLNKDLAEYKNNCTEGN